MAGSRPVGEGGDGKSGLRRLQDRGGRNCSWPHGLSSSLRRMDVGDLPKKERNAQRVGTANSSTLFIGNGSYGNVRRDGANTTEYGYVDEGGSVRFLYCLAH